MNFRYDIRNYTDTSLISDTYKGKLCARVKCLNCANISIIEEDFMGISLNIPDPVFPKHMKEYKQIIIGTKQIKRMGHQI